MSVNLINWRVLIRERHSTNALKIRSATKLESTSIFSHALASIIFHKFLWRSPAPEHDQVQAFDSSLLAKWHWHAKCSIVGNLLAPLPQRHTFTICRRSHTIRMNHWGFFDERVTRRRSPSWFNLINRPLLTNCWFITMTVKGCFVNTVVDRYSLPSFARNGQQSGKRRFEILFLKFFGEQFQLPIFSCRTWNQCQSQPI